MEIKFTCEICGKRAVLEVDYDNPIDAQNNPGPDVCSQQCLDAWRDEHCRFQGQHIPVDEDFPVPLNK